jgi:sugar transferase EpsL
MTKRYIDIFISGVALLAFAVPALIISLLVYVKLGRPIIFRQRRPGLNGKVFEMLKFRSMTSSRDESGALLPDSVRLTAFGKWLRSTSLDEVPGLWNVFRGDMSIVGPRPLLEDYLPLYSERQLRRHDVRPGLTGWAQINGRNAISWQERFDLDLWYVENRSMVLDMKIMLMTVWKVIRREDVVAANEATMPRFGGDDK